MARRSVVAVVVAPAVTVVVAPAAAVVVAPAAAVVVAPAVAAVVAPAVARVARVRRRALTIRRTRHSRVATVALAVIALGGGEAAWAAADCTLSTAGVNFGIYDAALATPTDTAGTLDIRCSYVPPGGGTPVAYTVMLGAGLAGSYTPRTMLSATATLQYNLYLDAARSLVWGNGLSGTGVASGRLVVGPGVGNGTRSESFTIYGRLPPQQIVGTGNFVDTLTVTIEF